jgi:uncharacterized protein
MALPPPRPGTTVVVTGATSGIGEAIARELAGRGYALTLVARRRERLEELRAELADAEVSVFAGDLASDRTRERLVSDLREGPAVIGLCNSAGVAAFGPLLGQGVEETNAVVRLNALALFDLTNRLVRDMAERGEGAVLNLGSIVAFAPQPQNATYGATKAFVASFSEALHAELGGSGVSVTVINPGPTRTEIWDRSGAEGASGAGPDVLWQDADEVARAAVDAMVAGRRSVVPGMTNKLASLAWHLTPRTALLPVMRVAQSPALRRLFLGRQSGRTDQ